MRSEPILNDPFATKPLSDREPQPARETGRQRPPSRSARLLAALILAGLLLVASTAVAVAVSVFQESGSSAGPPDPPAVSEGARRADGSKPAAAPIPAPVAIPDLPDYPGSTRIQYSTTPKAGRSKTVMVQLSTVDSFEAVKSFYDGVLTDGKWQLLTRSVGPDIVESDLRMGASLGQITITRKSTGVVIIRLERQDK
jgi:hypothetical protein